MTVMPRPVPARTHKNGIRPFRPVLPANNIRPYTVKTWQPPVPEPLPPAPLIGPGGLLALGGLVLAQLWGLANGRKGDTSAEEPGALGSWSALGAGSGELVLQYKVAASQQVFSSRWPASVVKVEHSQEFVPLWAGHPKGSGYLYVLRGYDITGALITSGSLTEFSGYGGAVLQNCSNPPCSVVEFVNVLLDRLDGEEPDPLPYVPYVPGPAPAPFPFPPAEPSPLPSQPQPQPLPLPTPSPAPPGTPAPAAPPATDPVPMEPGPKKPPIVVPAPLPPAVPKPAEVPGAQPLPNGVPAEQRPTPVPVTPPDAHFPVPGAPPVTGNGPRPTPEGIAQELGRLEQKLARLSDPGPAGNGDGTDRLGLVFQLLQTLIEFLTSVTAGGDYQLSSPCVLDENDQRVVSTVGYSGAPSTLGVVLNKLDALAELLQIHKDLKQPICRQLPPVGQPVTVNFVQID